MSSTVVRCFLSPAHAASPAARRAVRVVGQRGHADRAMTISSRSIWLRPVMRASDDDTEAKTTEDSTPAELLEGVNKPPDFPTLNLDDETYEKLPGWVKGDSLVEGADIRMIDVTSAALFLGILAYIFRNAF